MASGKIFRLTYTRGQEVKYVSHLDFVRMFERTVRRAGIDVRFSEGFNPRMEMVFGNPLPVGVTSACELMDIELNNETDGDVIVSLLNKNLPSCVRILSYVCLEKPYDTITKTVNVADYLVSIAPLEKKDVEKFLSCYESLTSLITMKKSKSGIKEVDIKPFIYGVSFASEDKIKISCATGIDNNLRPELAIKALSEKSGVNVEIQSIHKEKMYFI